MYMAATREACLVKQQFGWLGVNTVVTPDLLRDGATAASILPGLNVDEWALITPVPEGSAQGQPWFADEILPRVIALRAATLTGAFQGRVVIWNFLGTPNTSVLVTARGDIVLSGVRGNDDIHLGSLDQYSIDEIASAIRKVSDTAAKAHFAWREWIDYARDNR
jgi:hypothetical protein